MEYVGTVTPAQSILERPDVQERIRLAMDAMKRSPPPSIPGPNRKHLLEIVNDTAQAV